MGAVATQSYANTSYGPRTLSALKQNIPLTLIHQAFAETDPEHAQRQYGLVDAKGDSLTFTGDACHPWAAESTARAGRRRVICSWVLEWWTRSSRPF